MVEKGRADSMKFEYDFFVPNVGDLVVDGHDGTPGVVVSVGAWHTLAYFVDQGAVKMLVIQVSLQEYGGLIEQYSLKSFEKEGNFIVHSPVRFVHRESEDIRFIKSNF